MLHPVNAAIGAASGGAVATAWWAGISATGDNMFHPDALVGGILGGALAGGLTPGHWQSAVTGILGGMGGATLGRYLYARFGSGA